MENKNLLWHGEDLVEKVENIVIKIIGVGIVALLVYVYAWM